MCIRDRLQPAAGLIYSVLLFTTHVNAAVKDSLNLAVIKVSSGPLWGYISGKRNLEVLHCSSWTVLNTMYSNALLF